MRCGIGPPHNRKIKGLPMTLKRVLMVGVALCGISALSAVSANAATAPNIHLLALHNSAVVKTAVHHQPAGTATYTITVSTTISASADYKVKTPLALTYYTFTSSSNPCKFPKKQKITVSTKKTKYAKIGTSTETSTLSGCSTPDTFYGDTYDLTAKKAVGKTDAFVSTLKATFKNGGKKLKGTLFLDVTVDIGS
jgi:hypothetical protein